MKNGSVVAAFEKAFAEYVNARYAIALCNGTATLHTALVALGVKPGDRVAVPPLTMSATTIAVLQAGATPVFADVHPGTWLMNGTGEARKIIVSLYGLHAYRPEPEAIDDAAQTLRPHHPGNRFTSYSFQASKILALGEGGMLVTNDEELATRAREFSSLGYRMKAAQPRIDPNLIKASDYERHHSFGYNYRMADYIAEMGLFKLERADRLLQERVSAAFQYAVAHAGCEWIKPQHVPQGWEHSWWTYAVATDTPEQQKLLSDAMVRHGAERPFSAWRLTYQEPAFKYLNNRNIPVIGGGKSPDVFKSEYPLCPVAESLQPRICQFQTNNLESAERNSLALSKAIKEIGG